MSKKSSAPETVELDLSDVEHRVGKPVGGGQLWDPCSTSDIRRWAMAMDNPNPLHWNETFARESKFGGLVAPQSIAVALDFGHGAAPACVGYIPNSHLIFGGEEWWFYGVPVRPGDKLFQDRRFHDYKVTETKFAGPTMFSRGDTTHTNQHGALVARERSTAIRYLSAEATKRGMYENQLGEIKKWTNEELLEIEALRHEWLLSNWAGTSPHFDEVKVGDTLPRRVIGPHSIATFTTEYRAFLFNIWGTFEWVAPEGVEDPWINQDPGWVEGFGFDEEGAMIDPRKRDGLYVGPSRGHIDAEKAGEVGMARAYGYGATMGAWCTDFLANWAGHEGMVRHIKSDFRGPAFEGDVTYFDAEVVGKETDTTWGVPLVQIKLRLTNQDGNVLVSSTAEVELPL
ncbi:MaoC family dehydratase N-terminal domain-containing protein [Rhodococcus sp. (in: high G+C Gram-positive bacteria)]|uniref:FAS1-like dehydratase domain-containing protein n=1 Tax=unclassified Rhodococcus (in: high G+C Gram-positive bacteria) TaxID=192944 RepID=UPI0019E5828D|nr:MaoC family dehydratase N-terminal domain-containing protein [Rhodococcus sp. (in: high G+C Gram-positive bacteria)]MBF0662699.1 MaoC family dehydratase N-terminal domain-containing protein [Rhodococcus sp. (in: high G+C Gram-positive bacteria)]